MTIDDEDPPEPAEDETVEEFKQELEDDPSLAPADDEGIERLRGG
jgi:hypothetical protein